ncbi:ATP-grasp domain-containing protein [Streptomyces sp. NBC_00859]|uniref:ATP-grasp domain-containing protein n=1 Tax=Streptomyces sp. NBC_00859 TaxID=2903682 RepID=UPI0038702BCE|nr:ATP-grasp domain-containing protein [Streptomyces sp. NBC_00859]
MTVKSLLLVGGTDRHLDRAKELGARVVLFQHPDKLTARQKELADTLLVVDYTDWEAVRPLAVAAHRLHRFDAVVSLTEGGLAAAARLREQLGFLGTPHRATVRLRDKSRMRARLRDTGSRLTVETGRVTDRASLTAFGELAGYPFIVKPTDTTAGFGLLRVADAADAERAWARIEALRGGRTDRGSTLFTVTAFLMEAYIDGPEFSVEAFSFAGSHIVVAVTEKLVDELHFAELGHALPARLTEADRSAVTAAAVEFLTVMGVTDGPSHTEIRLSGRGPVVIEGHNRVGGGQIGELVRAAYGLDLTTYGIGWPLGLVPELRDAPRASSAACTRFLLRDPGRVVAVEGVPDVAAHPAVLSVEVSVRAGDTVRPVRDNWDRLGHVAVRAADTGSAVELCELLAGGRIRIEVAQEDRATAGLKA